MILEEFLQWAEEYKDYVPLYSSLVATGAFLFSVLSFVISNVLSKIRAKKEKEISDARYEEQKKQYEERLSEERKRREEDKRDMEERRRLSERPYLVYKRSEIVSMKSDECVTIRMEFLNKGRDSAYNIVPDLTCIAKKMGGTGFPIKRSEAVYDPIALKEEIFIMEWKYDKPEIDFFRITPAIRFEDGSGRKYKQQFCIDIYSDGNGKSYTYAEPELCDD